MLFMSERARGFVASELWLLIAVLTLPLGMLGGMIAESLSDVIITVGWFLLTPVFLFWGDEIAALVFSGDRSTAETESSNDDAVDELKRRYAEGEIGESEFERRLERLIALDEDGEFQPTGSNSTRAETDRERIDRGVSNSNRDRETE
jgi:uncharacterized membrane protein